MHYHPPKESENRYNHLTHRTPQNRGETQTSFRFLNNRRDASTQRELQQSANDNHWLIQNAQLQAMANNYAAIPRPPLQFKENRTGLPTNLKLGIENLSGHSMDDVRVHYNSGKPATLQAHAYAQGTDIHIASGQEKHLPHEAWHVVQQKRRRVEPIWQISDSVLINDDKGLEQEATVMGAKALQRRSLPPEGEEQNVVAMPAIQLKPWAVAQLTNGVKRDRQKGLDDKRKRLSVQPNFGPKEEEIEQPFVAPGHFRNMEQEMGADDTAVTPQELESQSEKEQVFSAAFAKVKTSLVGMTTVVEAQTETMRIKVDGAAYQVIVQKAPFGGKNSGADFFVLTLKRQVRKGKYRVFGSIVIKRMGNYQPTGFAEYDDERRPKFYDEMGSLDYMSGHKHSPTFHGAYLKDNTYFIGMELGSGNLSSKAEEGASSKDLSGWLISTAQVLADMHAAGRAHGDVKGDNVMISKSGGTLIGDYGETTDLNTGGAQRSNVAQKDDIIRYVQMVYKSLFGMQQEGQGLLAALQAKQEQTELDKVCILALAGCYNGDNNAPLVSMAQLATRLSDKSIWPWN